MPWLLSLTVFLVIVTGTLAWMGRPSTRDDEETSEFKTGMRVVGLVTGLIAVLLFGLSVTTIVSTRNVGIITSFSRPVGTLTNGLHLKWPWQHVPELNGTIRTDNQIGGFSEGRCGGGTQIRLANNSTACVDNTIRWRIVPTAGDTLFRDYRDDNNIRDSLVTRELNSALNEVFASYNPLSPDAAGGPNLTALSGKVTEKLRIKIQSQVEVQNVIISIVHFDTQTQDRINAYQAQIANTRIAEESQKTAAAQAQANRILADSVSRDPNVLVARCLDMINSGKQVPVGFNCWPGSGLPLSIPAR